VGTSPRVPPQPHIRSKLEGDYLVKFRKLDILADAVHLGVPWGCLVLIFLFTFLMVAQLAGKTTLANVGVRVLADIKVSQVLAYMFGAGGLGYGVLERKLRHKKVAHMEGHIKTLEAAFDPSRSSSGLTRKGTTRPEDKI
jgi:hypothetical protein